MNLYLGGTERGKDWVAWCYRTGNGRRRTYASDINGIAADVLRSLKVLYGIKWAETAHTKDSLHVTVNYHAGTLAFAVQFKKLDKKYLPEDSVVPEDRVKDITAALRALTMQELNEKR